MIADLINNLSSEVAIGLGQAAGAIALCLAVVGCGDGPVGAPDGGSDAEPTGDASDGGQTRPDAAVPCQA